MKFIVEQAILVLDTDVEVMIHRDRSSGVYTANCPADLDEDELIEIANHLNRLSNNE